MPDMTIHLHIDPFSGIAGDMFLGAAIDLGAPLDGILKALEPVTVAKPYQVTTQRVQRHGIGAVDLKVNTEADEHSHNHDHDHQPDKHHHHHLTHYRDLMAMIDQLDTTDRAKDRARQVTTKLAQAEAQVHGTSIEKVHFHEVGAVDSIVDMLGSAVALELLGVDTMSCGVLPISQGFVKCDHGIMPVPAPATAYLMRGLPTAGVDRKGELVTPTGAAIAAALCDSFGPPPAMTLQAIGYGAGDRQDPKIPNLLRLMLGELTTPRSGRQTPDPTPEPINA
jgi:pyridinium-3,5-bisthiocarboxylic acid mononucleotide nickel chelatase